MSLTEIQKKLRALADPKRAEASRRYFRTGPGQYGEGDEFIGLTVPAQRRIAYQFLNLSFSEIAQLLKSPVHEDRFVALEILVAQFEKGDKKKQKEIARFYLKNTKGINNWDLVDTSASYILGPVIDRKILYKLARSNNIWERRMAIISTGYRIGKKDFSATLKIATMLLRDSHDLIHKAVGWMLREVGKKDQSVLLSFLDKHATIMPRTMLRSAIERLPKSVRGVYLKKIKNFALA